MCAPRGGAPPFAQVLLAPRCPPVTFSMATGQHDILLENLTLLTADPAVAQAPEVLQNAGINTGAQFDQLQRITPTKQDTGRQAHLPLLRRLLGEIHRNRPHPTR